MIVYGSTISPFVRKLMAFAAEKGLVLELKNAGLGRGGPEFEEASPFGKMPGFRDPGADQGRDFCISDSTAIITYLDAKYPDPNLIPIDPIARARTIWYEEFADTMVCAMGGKLFFNRFVAPKVLKIAGDETVAVAAETTELPPLLDYLERVVPVSGFLVEDRITLADIAVCSPFVNLDHISVAIDPARWPRTTAYVAAILARPSFAPIIAREKVMVAALA
ncbi:MAG: glutathione S-transferase family protein [Pseudomonadota bacterium]|uniref:glutathione S-transferase family protein n=1 Tax=Sphingomonas sp. ERG5 TaxID=1381597 RepID=UPI00054BFBAC|nr:glutathione S-transferase family protein [Sphingomonas sp. ERG5]